MKIAVFIRGHKRTWKYVKNNIFNFFEQAFGEVDYYVALWQTKHNFNISDIENDFVDKKLKKYILVPNHYQYDNFTGPCYLSNLLTSFRIKEEILTNQKYDFIFDTRSDVAFKLNSIPKFPKENEIFCTRVLHEQVEHWQGMCDLGFMTTPKNHILWNQRNNWNQTASVILPRSGVHSIMYDYAIHNDLYPVQFDWFNFSLVRPDIVDHTIESIFDGTYSPPWGILDLADQIKFIEKANIGIDEYLWQITRSHS